jgi:uncharacterized membrane protein
MLGVVWVNHHAMFTRISSVDHGVLWRNLAMLLALSVLPFPTATVAYAMQHGTYGDQVIALSLYGLIIFAQSVTWMVMFIYLEQHRALLIEDRVPSFFREERQRAVLGILSPVLAVALGVVMPVIGLIVFLLMAIFYGITTEEWTIPQRKVHKNHPALP